MPTQIAKIISQMPTTINTRPPPRWIDCTPARSGWRSRFWAVPTRSIRKAIIIMMVTAAIEKASRTAVPVPTVKVCKARPARIGPVQPKPAKI